MAAESKTFTIWPFSEKVGQALLKSPGPRCISLSKLRWDLGLGLSDSEIHRLLLLHLAFFSRRVSSCGRRS